MKNWVPSLDMRKACPTDSKPQRRDEVQMEGKPRANYTVLCISNMNK